MPKYVLHYFDLYGRGEISRLIFAQAGVEFEDHRIPRGDDCIKKDGKKLNKEIKLLVSFISLAKNFVSDEDDRCTENLIFFLFVN